MSTEQKRRYPPLFRCLTNLGAEQALNDIEHRRTQVRRPQTNGFVERFNRTVLEEFFREAFRERFYDSVEALQTDLDAWLNYYNTERPHQGYRNQGRRPVETIQLYLESVPKAA